MIRDLTTQQITVYSLTAYITQGRFPGTYILNYYTLRYGHCVMIINVVLC